jgi:hypothetical protein
MSIEEIEEELRSIANRYDETDETRQVLAAVERLADQIERERVLRLAS